MKAVFAHSHRYSVKLPTAAISLERKETRSSIVIIPCGRLSVVHKTEEYQSYSLYDHRLETFKFFLLIP